MDNRLQISLWKSKLVQKNKELAAAEVKAKNNVKKGNMKSLPISSATAVRIKNEIAKLERDIAILEGINSRAHSGAATARAAALTTRAAALLSPPGGAGSGSASSRAAPIVAITAPNSRFFDTHMAAAVRRAIENPTNKEFVKDLEAYMVANGKRSTPFAGSKAFRNTIESAATPEKINANAAALAVELRSQLEAELKPNPLPTHVVRGGRSRRLKSKRNKRTRRHVR